MLLSIFLFAYWLSICLLWRNVYLDHLLFFYCFVLSFCCYCWVVWVACIFTGNCLFFTIENNISCEFFIYGFYYIEIGSLPPCPLSREFFFLIKNGCWILSKVFSVSIWDDHIFFLFFSLLMWCITLFDLWRVKNSCIPGINPTWSWCMIILIYTWMPFANILLRIFSSMLISDIGL